MTKSLRVGTGNLFRPNRELNRAIREIIILIREPAISPYDSGKPECPSSCAAGGRASGSHLEKRSLSPGHPARTFAEKAKRDAVRCLRDRHQTSGSSEVWHMPRCAMSCPCTENCLTKRSSSARTHREHERSFRSRGARPKMGQVSAAWGTLAS